MKKVLQKEEVLQKRISERISMKTLTPPTETKSIFVNGLAKKERKDLQARSDNEEIYEEDLEKDEARIDNSRKSSKPIKEEIE